MKLPKQAITEQMIIQGIEKAIRYTPSVYKNVEIRKAHYRDKSKKEIFVQLRGEGSNYGHNVMRDHTSNTAYFHIGKEGISQRCFSSKCRSFVHGPFPIMLHDSDILFPAKTQKDKRARSSDADSECREKHEIVIADYLANYEQVLYNVELDVAAATTRRNTDSNKRIRHEYSEGYNL